MKSLIRSFKDTCITGFFFMMPVIVIGIILAKAFGYLKSTGAKISSIFGLKSLLGIGTASIATVLLLIFICLLCGYLVIHYSFMKRFNAWIEGKMKKYIPGYNTYVSMAEEAIIKKEKNIPYTPAFFNAPDGSIKPVFLIEKNDLGDCVIVIPDPVQSPKGEILIVGEHLLTTLNNVTANTFNDQIRNFGKGILPVFQKVNGE